MNCETTVSIAGARDAIWSRITDIENAARTVSGIESVEVLERPATGLVGLKWRETRRLFGKTATEVMWITEAAENEFYRTRAESHGCIYESTLRIDEHDGGCSLTMTHQSTPCTAGAKVMAFLMAPMVGGAMRKAMQQDLEDIKAAVEGGGV